LHKTKRTTSGISETRTPCFVDTLSLQLQTALSAAGQGKAWWFGKQAGFFLFVACLFLFAYLPLVWYSETSNMTWLELQTLRST
jgi:hypothetical protein